MTKQEAFNFLEHVARGIAETFGECCETVVQEVVGNELIIAAIFNGHVSGRSVGSNIGILGGTLDTRDMDIHDIAVEDLNLFTVHPSGKKIKSSDFVLRGEDYTYLLGINYDVTLLEKMQSLVGQFLTYSGDMYHTLSNSSGRSLNEVYESVVTSFSEEYNGKPNKAQRIMIIKELDKCHFFELQKSVPFLSEKLNVSKYTLYKDLNELGIK